MVLEVQLAIHDSTYCCLRYRIGEGKAPVVYACHDHMTTSTSGPVAKGSRHKSVRIGVISPLFGWRSVPFEHSFLKFLPVGMVYEDDAWT
jgi:hypothetical protein